MVCRVTYVGYAVRKESWRNSIQSRLNAFAYEYRGNRGIVFDFSMQRPTMALMPHP